MAGKGRMKDGINQRSLGLSRKAIHSAVDASLARLNTSYIDLFQIHRFDYETPIEETMCALHDLVKDGKVRYVSSLSPEHRFLNSCDRFFEITSCKLRDPVDIISGGNSDISLQ